MMIRTLTTLAVFAVSCPTLARAADGFATPPDDERPSPENQAPRSDDFERSDDSERSDDFERSDDSESEQSLLRLSTGPVLRASPERADGGFSAALDIGARAAGARFSGSWVRVGSARGLSQYDVELWLDFGAEQRWHPILAAGAGFARLESGAAPSLHAATVGIGALRGTLEYMLPIRAANARAGLDVEGALPAIVAAGAPDVGGWVLVTARVGVGF